ncbi:MAG: hypothetical protein LUD52_02795 [Opitutae bacterium]|nr:hypothetical protein [Opitutae bacterium]
MELGLVARNGSVVAGNAGNALVGVDPKTFYSKDYGKLWEGTDETTDMLGKVEPRTLESPKFAFQNEDVNAERDVRTLERGDNELILSAVSDWLPGVKVSILGNEAFNRKLAEVREAREKYEQDFNSAMKFMIMEQEQADWNKALDVYEAGKIAEKAQITVLNRTPVVLQLLGAPNLPVMINKNVLDKVTNGKHHVPISELRKLLDNIDNPIAVFKSLYREKQEEKQKEAGKENNKEENKVGDAIVVLTEIVDSDGGNNAVVAIHLSKIEDSTGYEINNIASVYGKGTTGMGHWMRNNKLLYADTKRFRHFWESAQLKSQAEPKNSETEKKKVPIPEILEILERQEFLTDKDVSDIDRGIINVNKKVLGDIILAMHGSPWSFPEEVGAPYGKFNKGKIGMGEGAQSIGRGFYVTLDKEMAEYYANIPLGDWDLRRKRFVDIKSAIGAHIRDSRDIFSLKGIAYKAADMFRNNFHEDVNRITDKYYEHFSIDEANEEIDREITHSYELQRNEVNSSLREKKELADLSKKDKKAHDAFIDRHPSDFALVMFDDEYTKEAQVKYRKASDQLSGEIKELKEQLKVIDTIIKKEIPLFKKNFEEAVKNPRINSMFPHGARNLYTVLFHGSKVLDYNAQLTNEQWGKVKKVIEEKADVNINIVDKLLSLEEPPTVKELHDRYGIIIGKDGKELYISDVLSEAGFIGHRLWNIFVIYDGKDASIINHIRWQMARDAIRYQRAYTGSGARWAAIPGNPLGGFDANFIGTGEGAQAYGWGFYATSKWGIAKMYAVPGRNGKRYKLSDKFYEAVEEIENSGKAPKGYFSFGRIMDVAFDDFVSGRDVRAYFKSIVEGRRDTYDRDTSFLKAKKGELERHIKLGDLSDEDLEGLKRFVATREEDVEIQRQVIEEAIPETERIFYEILKSLGVETDVHHIYTLDFDDNAELLEWNTPLTEEQWERFIAVVKKNILRFTSEKDKNEILYASKPMSPKQLHNYAKNEIARTQKNGPRLISELLREAGFIGHTFPAASHGRGDYSQGTNYVFYGENDARVVDAHRWLRDENGGTMGWFNPATGEIVVRENSRIDTVLHELGWHATYAWTRDNAPELFGKMREYAAKAPQEVRDAVAKRAGKVVSWRLSHRHPKISPPTHFYHQPTTTKRVSGGNWVGGGSRVCCGLG